jgi:hypothetical protein
MHSDRSKNCPSQQTKREKGQILERFFATVASGIAAGMRATAEIGLGLECKERL